LQLRAEGIALANPRHPVRQQRLQPHRPGVACGFPHRGENRNHLLAVARLPPSWPPYPLFLRLRPIQQSNRILAVVSRGQAELVQQPWPCFSFRPVVALIHHPEVFPLRFVPQTHLPEIFVWSWVTSYVSRRPPLGLHFAWRDSSFRRLVPNLIE